MNEEKKLRIQRLFETDGSLWLREEAVRTVADVEQALNRPLPESLRYFLNEFGGGVAFDVAFAGLSDARGAEAPLCEDIIYMNEVLHKQMPRDLSLEWVYFAADDYANYYVDTGRMSNDECPVVAIGPGTSGDIAASFLDFAELAADGLVLEKLREMLIVG